MKISIITLFPAMIEGFIKESIIKRAVEKKQAIVELVQLRDFATDSYGTVDGKPYGGGTGMVLRVDVLHSALTKTIETSPDLHKRRVVLTSAKGTQHSQETALRFVTFDHLIIVAGHYEGVDERFIEFVDEEISLGDFVMTGGEIAASAITDSVVRLIPGVLKKDATDIESFSQIDGKRHLEFPHYTRPEEFMGKKVPPVLISGNHKEIETWRHDKAIEETRKKRPDLLT
jgi:tRNA (guanine37-N1)-methyltransferase